MIVWLTKHAQISSIELSFIVSAYTNYGYSFDGEEDLQSMSSDLWNAIEKHILEQDHGPETAVMLLCAVKD